MSTKWRRFEVMLPRQFNDGRDVPPEWISLAALEIGDHFGAASGVVRRTVEGNGHDLAPAPGGFFLHSRRRHVIGLQDLGELSQTKTNEAGIPHDVENIGERHTGEVVPQVRAQRPLDVRVRGRTPGGAG